MTDRLLLKWGTLKGGRFESEAARAALQKYEQGGICVSVMAQRDTQEQKQALLELIDAIDGEIKNDWSGDVYTKEQARKYVLEYDAS